MTKHTRTVYMKDSNGTEHLIQSEESEKEEMDRINELVKNFKVPSDSDLDDQLSEHEVKTEEIDAFAEEERIHKDEEFMKKYVV